MDDLVEALERVKSYVPVPPYVVTSTPSVKWDIFPAVAKIASTAHKTDVGGVIVGIKNSTELKEAIERLLKIYPRVVVQPMVRGVELFLGGRNDPHFGPVISLGLGGIFVEVYRDVSTRLAPVSEEDVLDMISELRGKKILEGYRGIKPNIDALVYTVVGFSRFLWEERPEMAEINPLIVNEEGAFAVDVRLRERSGRASLR